jgi:hypothetical protein
MATATLQPSNTSPPRWPLLLLWAVIPLLLALCLARVVVWLQTAHVAAIGVFPAICGLAIGWGLVSAAHAISIRSRSLIICTAIFAAAMTSVAEHVLFYLDYRHDFTAKLQSDPKLQMAAAFVGDDFKPATFSRFMTAEAPAKWLLWTFDALAMITIAAVVAWLMSQAQHTTKLVTPPQVPES